MAVNMSAVDSLRWDGPLEVYERSVSGDDRCAARLSMSSQITVSDFYCSSTARHSSLVEAPRSGTISAVTNESKNGRCTGRQLDILSSVV